MKVRPRAVVIDAASATAWAARPQGIPIHHRISSSQTDDEIAMDDWNLPWTGGCRCGRLRFEITAPPLLTMACHCTGCQKMSASAFSLSMAIPEAGFRVTEGNPVVGGMHGQQVLHRHCDWCKSWVFTEMEPSMGFVNVRPSMLDDAAWFAPYVETYTSEALPWARTGAVHSFAQFPAMEDYGPLVAEFTTKGSRPVR